MISKLLRLSKESLIYSLSGFAGRFIGIFFVPIYTRIFSPDQYGIIDLIATMTSFITLFLIMGLDSAVARYYVDAENDEDKKLTASTGLFYSIFCSFFVILILISLSRKVSAILLGESVNSIFLTVALAAIPFSVLSSYCLNMMKWRFQPSLYAATSIGSLLLQVSLTVYLVVLRRMGILGIYIAQLVTTFVFSVIRFFLTKSSYSLVFSLKRVKELVYYGVPLVPLSLAYYIMTYSDRYFLRHFSGLDEVGLYGIGYRLSSAIGLIVMGFQHAWGPFVISTYKDTDAKETFAKTYDYVAIVICFAVLVLSLFSREVLRVFTTPKYFGAYVVVPFIAASVAAPTLGGYFAVGIGIAKKTIHRAWSSGVAAAINLILNIVLIPRFGMIGAAIATIVSLIVLGMISILISQRYYHVDYKFSKHFVMYFIAALTIFITYRLLPVGLTFLSIGPKLALLMGFMVLPFLLRLIGKREINYVRSFLVKNRRKH